MNEIHQKTDSFCTEMANLKTNVDLWKEKGYKFVPEMKHPDIKIVSDTIVKSSNNSGYKFALMEPSV